MDSQELRNRTQQLVDVVMGRAPADMVLRGGHWVCVQSGEIIDDTDVAVKGERIAYVGPDASHTIGPETLVVEAKGRFLVPGLLDGHVHIESSMITLTEFVRAVVPLGTTGLFIDPHEIANVFGLRGVRLMLDEAVQQPIHVWVQIPSCVPSAPGLETPGAEIGPNEVAEALTWPGVIGLGEMMNFPGVYNSDPKMHAEMAETRRMGKVIGGHYASPDLGLPFHGYVAGGPEDDHEGTRMEDAVARVRQGMKAMLRLGSGWDDVDDQIVAVTKMGMDPRHFLLVTDDIHSGTLINDGHMNRVVKRTIEIGLDPIIGIQMATLNTAEHFGVARDVGQIAPGRYADILIVSDLDKIKVDTVIAKGIIVAEDGKLMIEPSKYDYPPEMKNSVRLGRELQPEDFVIHSTVEGEIEVNVIGVIENQALTRHLRVKTKTEGGQIPISIERDLAKVALVERHRGTGEVQLGFVSGFGFSTPCAIGSTVAHDSHHMIVVGTDDVSMAFAANELWRAGGGQIVVRNREVLALVELPIAGLMSDERVEVVAEKVEKVLGALGECGCKLNNANMQLSLLALVVIPELRISDKGLVDVTRFEVIPLVE